MNLRNEKQSLDQEIPQLKKDYGLMLDYFSESHDWRAICLAIAKEEPEVIVKYIQVKSDTTSRIKLDSEDIRAILFDIGQGRKIQAIKTVRKMTGFGLKEAKDVIDHLATIRSLTLLDIKNHIQDKMR